MFQLGLVSVTYRALTPEEIIPLCRAAGLHAIEWGSDIHVRENDLDRAREVGRMTRDAGLCVSSYGSYYRLGQHQDFAPFVRTAAALGAPVIRIWAGTRGSADVPEGERAALIAEAKASARMAASEGMTVDFEYHPQTLTDEKESAVRLVEAIDEPNCRLYWQPDFKKSPEERMQGLQMALPYVDVCHVFHWAPSGARLPLMDSVELWQSYVNCFPPERTVSLLLEFVPGDDPACLAGEAAALRRIAGQGKEGSTL